MNHFDTTAMNGPRASRRRLLRSLGALALGGATGLVASPAAARGLRLGEPAPPAVLVTLDGTRIASADLLGQVVILTFWATYCGPCREELPLLSAYAATHATDGLRVLGFCIDEPDSVAAVRDVARTLSFPVGFLREDSAPAYGRIWRMPVSFVIDRAGRLRDNGWARRDSAWTAASLERIVTPLLSEGAP